MRTRKPILFLTLLLIALVYMPTLALAGDGSPLPSTSGDPLTNFVKLVIVSGIAAIGERVWGWLSHKKAGAAIVKQLDVHQLEQMIAEEAIDFADEQAHKAVKFGKEKLDGIAKKAEARGYVDEVASARKLGKDSVDRVLKIIEARLSAQRKEAAAGLAPVRRLAIAHSR